MLFSYFDSSVLTFLRKLHGQSLLSNVNLEFAPDLPNAILHRVLGQMLPLIGINSISFFDKNLLAEMQNAMAGHAGTIANDEFWPLLTTILAQTRILSIKLVKRRNTNIQKKIPVSEKRAKWWTKKPF
jgi:hypothetical protein